MEIEMDEAGVAAELREEGKERTRSYINNGLTWAESQRAAQTLTCLSDRIADYRRDATETRQRLDAFFRDECGINSFTRTSREWWGATHADVSLCMARQIPTWSVEGVSLHVLGEWMRRSGLPNTVAPISFHRDGYGNHGYKNSLPGCRLSENSRRQ